MKPTTILLLQAIGVTVQILNAGIAAEIHNGVVTLCIAAIAGGYQFFVQHIGNQAEPK
jgi:hypothetical protein